MHYLLNGNCFQFCRSYYISHFLSFLQYLFIYFWLCWVFTAVRGLSSSRSERKATPWLRCLASGCGGLSCGALALGAHASVVAAPELQSARSVAAVHGFSCSAACGSFPGLGSNLCLPLWQADSLPLSHQGSPAHFFVLTRCISERELPTQYWLVEKGPRVFSELESHGWRVSVALLAATVPQFQRCRPTVTDGLGPAR